MGKRPLISADNHVMEPVGLWQERLPVGMRERGPRLERQGSYLCMVVEGMPPRKLTKIGDGNGNGAGVGGAAASEQEARRAHLPGGFDPEARLADMALDGVVAEVIYPTFGLFIDMVPDPELQMACARVYNDWLAESFLHRPDVFIPAAVVPVRAVESATAELARVAELGFKAAMIPTTPPEGTKYNSDTFDPLWRVAVDAGVPLSLHTGTGALPNAEKGPGGAVINYAKVGLLSAETLCYFAASGVLERFPDLRLVFVETGAGWLPFCLERMDEAFEEHEQWVNPKLEQPPSAYAARQCSVTLGADRTPILAREITGVGPLLWASDYPHPEGTFPHSQEVVERIFAGVPDHERDMIVAGNAARLYGIDLDRAHQPA
jgi:predicted TIM-barrel fold metal-dependent hydrolase